MSTPRRYELLDFEWSIIQPLLPNKPRGVPRADDRKVLNGMHWRLRTGLPWADIPEPSLGVRDDLRQSLPPVGRDFWDGIGSRGGSLELRWRPANGRLVVRPGSSAWRQRQPGGPHATPAAARDHARAQCMGARRRRTDDQDRRACRRQRTAGRAQAHGRTGRKTAGAPRT